MTIRHVTKDHAVGAGIYYGTFYHRTVRNADGSAARCRVNGKCKVWKTRPNDFRLPVKYGFKDCFYITPRNAADWLLRDPTSPGVLLESFRTTDVVNLAVQTWFDESVGPILADALEDAGYNDQKILSRLRSNPFRFGVKHSFVSYLLPDGFFDCTARIVDGLIHYCTNPGCPHHGESVRRETRGDVSRQPVGV